jgi:hypothetical protein
MQAARSALNLLRAIALCSLAMIAAAAIYMCAAEHYDEALARMEKSVELFIVFIVAAIGCTLAMASFVSNLMVGQSNRDDRVLLAMKLKECAFSSTSARRTITHRRRYIVTHLAMASFLSGERSFGHPGDIFESSLWMMWCTPCAVSLFPLLTFAAWLQVWLSHCAVHMAASVSASPAESSPQPRRGRRQSARAPLPAAAVAGSRRFTGFVLFRLGRSAVRYHSPFHSTHRMLTAVPSVHWASPPCLLSRCSCTMV